MTPAETSFANYYKGRTKTDLQSLGIHSYQDLLDKVSEWKHNPSKFNHARERAKNLLLQITRGNGR